MIREIPNTKYTKSEIRNKFQSTTLLGGLEDKALFLTDSRLTIYIAYLDLVRQASWRIGIWGFYD